MTDYFMVLRETMSIWSFSHWLDSLAVVLMSGPFLTVKVCLQSLRRNCAWFTKESTVKCTEHTNKALVRHSIQSQHNGPSNQSEQTVLFRRRN